MSLNIQEQHAAVPAASPVEPVSLSERVEARQPARLPQQMPEEQPQHDINDSAPASDDVAPEQLQAPMPRQLDASLPREHASRRRDATAAERGQTQALLRHAGKHQGGLASNAPLQRPGGNAQPSSGADAPVPAVVSLPAGEPAPALAAVAAEGKPSVVASVPPAPSVIAPEAAKASSTTNGLLANTPAEGTSAALEGGARTQPSSSTAARVQRDYAATAIDKASGSTVNPTPARSAPVEVAPAGAVETAPQRAVEPSAAADATQSTVVQVMTGASPQQGVEAGTDGQTLADARRADANLGTRQHVRAARQAEALQTAMAQRADAASQVHVSFNSWGAGHSVTARLDGGRLHMQSSSARVAQALTSAVAPDGAELQIAVDSSDSATDERRRRHGGQGDA